MPVDDSLLPGPFAALFEQFDGACLRVLTRLPPFNRSFGYGCLLFVPPQSGHTEIDSQPRDIGVSGQKMPACGIVWYGIMWYRYGMECGHLIDMVTRGTLQLLGRRGCKYHC